MERLRPTVPLLDTSAFRGWIGFSQTCFAGEFTGLSGPLMLGIMECPHQSSITPCRDDRNDADKAGLLSRCPVKC